jgi:hypothetical protein
MSFRHELAIGPAALMLLLAIGCGDDSDPDSSGSAGSAGSAGAASGGTAGGGGTGGGTSGSAGVQAGGGSGTAGSSSGGASGSAGSGGGSGTSGSSGSSSVGSVECGSTSCPVPAELCCALYNQPHICISPGESCFPGVDVACDGPEDCPGQICCGKLFIQGQNKSYELMSCESSCTGKDRREICGSSGTCTTDGSCGPSDLLPQYRDCK